MIHKCNKCGDYRSAAAQFQDAKYGAGMRVFNKTGKGQKCTVCGETIQGSSAKATKKE